MSTKTNLILDITILSAFLVIANPSLTGNSIHEWLGVSFAAAIITHLLFHWKWLVNDPDKTERHCCSGAFVTNGNKVSN
jgi:hypothetical protein